MLNHDSYWMRKFHSEVKTHVTLLTQVSDSIKEKLEEIFIDTRRYKRGIIDGLGSIFKSITGNLDASDGKYFTDSINKLNQDQHQIENLLKNQISVTISITKSFNETIQKLLINEKTLSDDMNKIDKAIHQLGDNIALVKAKMNFFEICEKLLESYLYLQDKVNDILNSITFARLKIIHSSIITPDNLIVSLQEISQNLVKNNLPLPVKYSKIAQYLEIIELEAFQTNSDLVFVLRIPLVEQHSYTLYHLYPVPILDNRTGLHHVLSFSQKFIARNDDSLMYVPVKDLNTCKQLSPRNKLCSNLYAYPIDSNAACEVQLLKNFGEIPKNCHSALIFGQGYNVQKLEENVWLVIVSKPIHATINCFNMNTKTVVLNQNSVLKLQPKCNAYVGITKLQAETYNTFNVTDNSHPVLIPYDCCSEIPEKINLPKLKPLQFENLNIDNLEVANHKLEQYSRDLDKLINEPFVTKNISWFTYFIIILIIILILAYIANKCKNRYTTSESKSSKPIHGEALRRINNLLKRRPNIHQTDEEINPTDLS